MEGLLEAFRESGFNRLMLNGPGGRRETFDGLILVTGVYLTFCRRFALSWNRDVAVEFGKPRRKSPVSVTNS